MLVLSRPFWASNVSEKEERLMKILKLLLIATALIVLICAGAFIVAGLTLPASQSFENEVEIDASADKVWDVITDKDRYVEWQTQLDKVEIANDKSWTEYPKDSPEPLKFSLGADERPSRMEFHYTMGNSFSGHWKGEIAPTASGVKLKTTDSYSTQGLLTRILIYTFFDMESFAKDWNAKLKARVESLNK
jgi:uncharacterized protein YndB with AHSA1/START domain